jgi:hypothetical protein
MVRIDLEALAENLLKIPREEEFGPDKVNQLKKLFLVLAGDRRVIGKLALEDVADLFNSAPQLLGDYENELEYIFEEGALEDYADAGRRAV